MVDPLLVPFAPLLAVIAGSPEEGYLFYCSAWLLPQQGLSRHERISSGLLLVAARLPVPRPDHGTVRAGRIPAAA